MEVTRIRSMLLDTRKLLVDIVLASSTAARKEPQIASLPACYRLESVRWCCYVNGVLSWLLIVRRMGEASNWLARLEDSLAQKGGPHRVNDLGDANNV
jgi:hypothetical protein